MWRWALGKQNLSSVIIVGAMPAERKVPHTFLNIPALANEIDQGLQWKPVVEGVYFC